MSEDSDPLTPEARLDYYLDEPGTTSPTRRGGIRALNLDDFDCNAFEQ